MMKPSVSAMMHRSSMKVIMMAWSHDKDRAMSVEPVAWRRIKSSVMMTWTSEAATHFYFLDCYFYNSLQKLLHFTTIEELPLSIKMLFFSFPTFFLNFICLSDNLQSNLRRRCYNRCDLQIEKNGEIQFY